MVKLQGRRRRAAPGPQTLSPAAEGLRVTAVAPVVTAHTVLLVFLEVSPGFIWIISSKCFPNEGATRRSAKGRRVCQLRKLCCGSARRALISRGGLSIFLSGAKTLPEETVFAFCRVCEENAFLPWRPLGFSLRGQMLWLRRRRSRSVWFCEDSVKLQRVLIVQQERG